jgi:type IV secretion system protein VirB9
MMKKRSIAMLMAACVSARGLAREIPHAGGEDARMRSVVYDPNQVVRLSTAIGAALVVSFSPEEKITAVAVTDSKDLIANPRDNFLFMKAKLALSPQPVIVLTSGPHGTRRYVFEIACTPMQKLGVDNPDVYYSVEFRYPGDEAAAREVTALRRSMRERQMNAAYSATRAHDLMDNATQDPFTGAKNWHYVAQGNRALLPLEVMDNGYSTAFRFPGNVRIPGIFRLNPDGKEASVNYAVKGDYVVVAAIASSWRLRDGNTVLCIFNRSYDKVGKPTSTGTTSPEVRRITRRSPA